MWLDNKYRIIRVTPELGDTYYLAQKRSYLIFWDTFQKSVPIGTSYFYTDMKYKSYQEAEDAIIRRMNASKRNKLHKEVIYPGIGKGK